MITVDIEDLLKVAISLIVGVAIGVIVVTSNPHDPAECIADRATAINEMREAMHQQPLDDNECPYCLEFSYNDYQE